MTRRAAIIFLCLPRVIFQETLPGSERNNYQCLRLKVKGLFIVVSALSLSSESTGTPLK